MATALAALLVCWAVGVRGDGPYRVAGRLGLFALVVAAYELSIWLISRHMNPDSTAYVLRLTLSVSLVAGLLVQNLLSPNLALRRLAQPLLRWRAPWSLYLFALLAWPLLTLLVVLLSHLLPRAELAPTLQRAWLFSAAWDTPYTLLLRAPWALAWFGYGVPVLLRRRSPLVTGFVLGAFTWLHLSIPWAVHGSVTRPDLYLDLAGGLTLAVVAVWIFQRARGSVLPVLLLAASTSSFLLLNWDGGAFGAGSFYGIWIALVTAEAALAAGLVLQGRMWRAPRESSAEDPHAAEARRDLD